MYNFKFQIKGSRPFLRKLGLAKRHCLVCNDPETKHFKACETDDCRAVYCEECWIDIEVSAFLLFDWTPGPSESVQNSFYTISNFVMDDPCVDAVY